MALLLLPAFAANFFERYVFEAVFTISLNAIFIIFFSEFSFFFGPFHLKIIYTYSVCKMKIIKLFVREILKIKKSETSEYFRFGLLCRS